MLKDITLGQFFPGQSVVHRMDPRAKILGMILFIVALFMAKGIVASALCLAFVVLVIGLSKISPKMILKSLKPILILIIITAILNMLYTPGDILVSFWIIKITRQGVVQAFYMVLRIVLLIAITSLLTYTTSPIALTDAIERLLSPLKKIKVPVHEFAMMMTIALRFIPTLIEETDKIMSAQKSRGADFESGNLISRAKALIPILIPLLISAFRRAEDLAVAMECRLYRGGSGRTRLKVLHFSKVDALSGSFIVVFCAAIIVSARLLP